MNLFKKFNEFEKQNLMENRALAQYAKPIEDMKALHPDAVIIDITSRSISYNKRVNQFSMDEKDFGKNPDNVEQVILYNPKRENGVLMTKGEMFPGDKNGPAVWAGRAFISPLEVAPKWRHTLFIDYKKPKKMSHADAMGKGFFGSLD